jgi:selenide,water dikinase
VHPDNVKRNAGARPGDRLVLGKPLGVGVYSAALKKEKLAQDDYRTMIESTTKLNTPGVALAALPFVHAMTDVTGSDCSSSARDLPWVECGCAHRLRTHSLAPERPSTGAGGLRHGRFRPQLAGYGSDVDLASGADEATRALLTDPQTSAACSSRATRRASGKCSRSSARRLRARCRHR